MLVPKNEFRFLTNFLTNRCFDEKQKQIGKQDSFLFFLWKHVVFYAAHIFYAEKTIFLLVPSQFEIIQSKTNYSSLKDSYWIQVSLGLVKRLTASLYNFASFSTVRKFFMTNPFITNNSMNSLRSINNAWSIMSSKESSFLKSSYIEKKKKRNHKS